ncbi:porin [Novosphingobium sp. PASSN1]|uniref:porin n=1 Tax=Novosphingobium sp. PASSN1 TaxID=2015561 RepID=UPI000BDCD6EB|nr:porin [Novosphingobium sp. PASSN1]OYU34633.1 MAG: porin [Novosphingobium sp. PASSN1]
MNTTAFRAALLATSLIGAAGSAHGQTDAAGQDAKIAALQAQVDRLTAMVEALQAANRAAPALAATSAAPVSASAPAAAPAAAPVQMAAAVAPAPSPAPAHSEHPKKKAWYEKIMLRGYTQLRMNEIVSGPKMADAGISRLRSVQDSGINENGSFSIRRARLVVQGDISDRVSLYMQGDLAAAVSNQSGTERRENFFQMRDAYADVFLDKAKTLRLRLGQSKVPFGWENMQSSSNRIPLDRTDAINAPVPGERDIGAVAYFTPVKLQKIWDALTADGQKLFGNYGAFGVGVFNGQGTNRTERTGGLMTVAMMSIPIRLDGLGGIFEGQVAEFGASGMRNQFKPEVRSGGVSTLAYRDDHVAVHGMIYPKPFGIQAEWTWGKGPQWDPAINDIVSRRTTGGYVMGMLRAAHTPVGQIIPFVRWQHYRGGWKAAINAPRLETDETEVGVEWLPLKELELTVSYANVTRNEADERRAGRAKGDILRAQVQWNY